MLPSYVLESIVIPDAVREIAMSQTRANLGVYGGSHIATTTINHFAGAENKLNLCDFNGGLLPIKSFLADSGVSSVRWTQFHNGEFMSLWVMLLLLGSVISATTEGAQVHLYDVNASTDSAAWTYKGDLPLHKVFISFSSFFHCLRPCTPTAKCRSTSSSWATRTTTWRPSTSACPKTASTTCKRQTQLLFLLDTRVDTCPFLA